MGVREHHHRLARERYQGEVAVSITTCFENAGTAFVSGDIVKQFVSFLTQKVREARCRVPVYCFMPEHLHLIIRGTCDEADVLTAMYAFKQQTGFWFRKHSPYRWQKDFHDHIIRSDEDLDAHIRYIANNPVRRGLVESWGQYPFTGAIDSDLQATMEGL
jgi:putative transposase